MTDAITDVAGLRERYREPAELAAAKVRTDIAPVAAEFIARSPLFVLATGSSSGADASPRGGPPGFVAVLDAHRIAWGDLAGNNLLDSFTNIVEQPHVGLLFLVPGSDGTVRVNGRASITEDPQVLDATGIDGRRPKVAVVVEVDQCYVHCAKAFRRSALWDTTTWPAAGGFPTTAEIVADQHQLDGEMASVIDQSLEENYRDTMWTEGGDLA
ncbi:MAG: pyridoxamine 5'-phosphate oxidase family protein [Acidimicrobiales bacterium]|nr:pyridoxamine 5'-phosphate oxidase family protein [Acidimicrobiales bacterium]